MGGKETLRGPGDELQAKVEDWKGLSWGGACRIPTPEAARTLTRPRAARGRWIPLPPGASLENTVGERPRGAARVNDAPRSRGGPGTCRPEPPAGRRRLPGPRNAPGPAPPSVPGHSQEPGTDTAPGHGGRHDRCHVTRTAHAQRRAGNQPDPAARKDSNRRAVLDAAHPCVPRTSHLFSLKPFTYKL